MPFAGISPSSCVPFGLPGCTLSHRLPSCSAPGPDISCGGCQTGGPFGNDSTNTLLGVKVNTTGQDWSPDSPRYSGLLKEERLQRLEDTSRKPVRPKKKNEPRSCIQGAGFQGRSSAVHAADYPWCGFGVGSGWVLQSLLFTQCLQRTSWTDVTTGPLPVTHRKTETLVVNR